jgi:hypothetical protein
MTEREREREREKERGRERERKLEKQRRKRERECVRMYTPSTFYASAGEDVNRVSLLVTFGHFWSLLVMFGHFWSLFRVFVHVRDRVWPTVWGGRIVDAFLSLPMTTQRLCIISSKGMRSSRSRSRSTKPAVILPSLSSTMTP